MPKTEFGVVMLPNSFLVRQIGFSELEKEPNFAALVATW